MSEKHDEESDIKAAKVRLKRFVKKANECKNHHDPGRLEATKSGRTYIPKTNGWSELARRYRML